MHPNKKIVAVFHWNYEFEQYPQPADREFARHLVDLGVDAIVGHHSHIIQGFEYYKEVPIFYGLGNFYFPSANFDGFDLAFPEVANTGLSVKFDGDACKIYITRLEANNTLSVVEEGRPQDSDFLKNLSQFSGMSHSEYKNFFRKFRVKRKALPIYYSYKDNFINFIKDKFVVLRQKPVDLLGRIKGAR